MPSSAFRFNARQRAALTAICDTFAPGGDGLPSASEHGVVDAIQEAIAANPRAAERRQVAMLMGLWDTKVLTAIGGGGFERFSRLSQRDREDVLRSWRDSRAVQRRGVYQALRRGALLMYLMKPGPDGRTSPVWERAGFPGLPDVPAGEVAAPSVHPKVPDRDERLECDVVVVGSGAGGGAAAAALAAAGLDVVVLEAGEYVPEGDLVPGEYEGYGRLYLNGGAMASDDAGTGILAGATLGGGTTVTSTPPYRPPAHVREEWARAGVRGIDGDDYERSMDSVFERLGVNDEHTWPSRRDELLQEAAQQLGWSSIRVKRNAHGCPRGGEACATCGFGCPYGAKQSTARTWLADAEQRGARILVRARAQKVNVEGGAARGVEAVTWEGRTVTVRSRAVVSAAGALHTPALLRRSELSNEHIGKHLHVQPATVMWGVLDQEVRPWEGVMQAIHVDQFTDLDGRGYGVRHQTAPVHPGFFGSWAPWDGAEQYRTLLEGLSHTTAVGFTVRDQTDGEVRVGRAGGPVGRTQPEGGGGAGREGEPVVRYRLSETDQRHARRGMEASAKMLEAMGAQR